MLTQMLICESICVKYNHVCVNHNFVYRLRQLKYQGLIDKNYNTVQIRSDYGTRHTLSDVIKASAHTCFGFFGVHFVVHLFVQI